MKKLLSLLLCFSLCLSLSACGQPAATDSTSSASSAPQKPQETVYAEFVPEYSNVAAGYITHQTAVNYTVTKADGYECTDNFYIFLPENSKISSDKELVFFTYAGDMSLNVFMMSSAGLTVNGFEPVFASGEYTISSNCFVRICVKGKLSDVKIRVPEESLASVVSGTADEISVAKQVFSMNEYLYGRGNSVNYIFLTDLHVGSFVNDPDGDGLRNYDTLEFSSQRMAARKQQVRDVVSAANISPYIDFVVIGGDIINGYETPESLTYQEAKNKNPSLTVRQHCIDQLVEVLSPLKDCKKPVFVLAGNHDDNAGHSLWQTTNHPSQPSQYPEYLLSDLDWEKNVFSQFTNVKVVRDESYSYGGKSISKYFYYDLEKNGKKVRIIGLDCDDRRRSFGSDGAVLDLKVPGGRDKQHKWLAEIALRGEFDECIVLSHAPINYSHSRLLEIFKAYQNRQKYTTMGANINADFSTRSSGNILFYHHGHEHENMESYVNGAMFWMVGSDASTIDVSAVTTDSCFRYNFTKGNSTELKRTGGKQ